MPKCVVLHLPGGQNAIWLKVCVSPAGGSEHHWLLGRKARSRDQRFCLSQECQFPGRDAYNMERRSMLEDLWVSQRCVREKSFLCRWQEESQGSKTRARWQGPSLTLVSHSNSRPLAPIDGFCNRWSSAAVARQALVVTETLQLWIPNHRQAWGSSGEFFREESPFSPKINDKSQILFDQLDCTGLFIPCETGTWMWEWFLRKNGCRGLGLGCWKRCICMGKGSKIQAHRTDHLSDFGLRQAKKTRREPHSMPFTLRMRFKPQVWDILGLNMFQSH